MDFSHYSDEPVQLAVDLVNSLHPIDKVEKLETPEDIASLVGDRTSGWEGAELAPTDTDLKEIRSLRKQLRAVFEAADETEAARILNGVLGEVGATPRISVHGMGPHLHFEASGESVARWLGAVTAMGLTTALIEGGFERFGTCDSKTCDDAYVDTSRNRSRRNCSEKCTTRENVAAYRSRLNN
ncbi:MAG: CGNR zinc finger domain-containing protein [Acidimicrobiia bacterium]